MPPCGWLTCTDTYSGCAFLRRALTAEMYDSRHAVMAVFFPCVCAVPCLFVLAHHAGAVRRKGGCTDHVRLDSGALLLLLLSLCQTNGLSRGGATRRGG